MRPVWILALNTFKEVIRDRILYALVLFAFLLMGFSLALGQLSFAEQARISANFGMSAIHLCAVMLAVFIGSNLVYKEIEKKTILTILARPISRMQFILGKCLGLTLLILTMVSGLALILALVFCGLDVPIGARFILVLVGLLAESLVLLGFTLVFSMITKPLLVVCFSVGIFLIGHWQSSLDFFVQRSQSRELQVVAVLVRYLIPDLERVNWQSLILYDEPLAIAEKLWALAYSLSWFGVCVCLAVILFKRKDVG